MTCSALVVLLLAEARSTALAMSQGNQDMVRELLRLREAIYDFAFEPPIDGEITETRPSGPPPARLPSLETPLEALDDD